MHKLIEEKLGVADGGEPITIEIPPEMLAELLFAQLFENPRVRPVAVR